MSKKTALWLGGLAAIVILGGVALMAALPGTDWAAFEEAEIIAAKASPEEAYPGLSKIADRSSTVRPGRNVVLDVSCPDGPAAMQCAAGATRAAALWFASHGSSWPGSSGEPGEVAWLLVNVTTPSAPGAAGPQLIGDVQPVAQLADADVAEVLNRFAWNGSGDLGEVPAAEWCQREGGDGAFCRSFRADVCNDAPRKEPAVQRLCALPQGA